jgi:ADP-ribose pyrophosphatase YjhB (NUDIX family)
MPAVVRKAFAYITHDNRLLVFRHIAEPRAGIQVPAGTVAAGEHPEDAALREATEETGLSGLEVVRFLGEIRRDRADVGLDEIHHRFFYHLRCTADPPETWRHAEHDPSDGSPGPIAFEFFWAPLPNGVPELIAGHDALLDVLATALGANA